MSDVGKIKRGDMIIVQSQARSAHGLYAVVAVGKAWFEAVPADMQSSMQRNKLQLSDLAAHIVGTPGPALPAASGMDLDTPPPARVDATAPAEELAPAVFVKIRVTQPQKAYRVDGFRGGASVTYEPVAHGRDRTGQPQSDFIVTREHAARLARGDVALELLEDPLGTPVKEGR